jgi:tetratricopeptide (TPR) repeat protein
MKPSILLALLLLAVAPAHAADEAPVSRAAPRAADHLGNARVAIDRRDWDQALRELQAAERDTPRSADVHNLMGYTYRKRANPDLAKAFEHYNIALKFNPQHKGAHEYIGEAYLMDKRPQEAELHLVALEKICGNRTCEEYQDLAKSIADYKAKN